MLHKKVLLLILVLSTPMGCETLKISEAEYVQYFEGSKSVLIVDSKATHLLNTGLFIVIGTFIDAALDSIFETLFSILLDPIFGSSDHDDEIDDDIEVPASLKLKYIDVL